MQHFTAGNTASGRRRVPGWLWLEHVGRFPGITVVADRITKSQSMANANLYFVRTEVDEEDRMTFVAAEEFCATADSRLTVLRVVL